MVAGARYSRLLAATLAAIIVLVGCAYNGKVSGEIGDPLTFSVSSDRKTELTLTVLDLEPADPSDADSWGIERDGGDAYFVHFSASQAGSAPWQDWAVVTESNTVVFARTSIQPPGRNIPNRICDEYSLAENPCLVFIVPSGEKVTSVRYYGVNSGYVRGSGVGDSEWVSWSVE